MLVSLTACQILFKKFYKVAIEIKNVQNLKKRNTHRESFRAIKFQKKKVNKINS